MKAGRFLIIGFLICALVTSVTELAVAQTHKGISFQAMIKRNDGTLPTQTGTSINLKILSPNNCILREETVTGINIVSGYLNLTVGKGTVTGADPNKTMAQVMNNTQTTSGLTCLDANGNVLTTNGTYTATDSDIRKLRLSMFLGSDPIMADFNMKAVAFAVNSETLNGKSDTNFVNINAAQKVTQPNVESIFSRYTKLDAILNNYNNAGTSVATDISGNAATATTALTATTATNVTGTVAIANGGTGATSASAARTNLGLGPLATLSVAGSPTSSTYLRGDGTWSSVSAGGVTVGTTTGTVAAGDDTRIVNSLSQTAFNSYISGASCTTSQTMYWNSVASKFACADIALADQTNVTVTGNMTADNVLSNSTTAKAIYLFENSATPTKKITICSPSSLPLDWNFTLPSTKGNSGEVLSTDGNGTASWIPLTSAPVSSVAGRTGAVTLSSTDISDFNTAADTRANGRITALRGAANGVAALDSTSRVPASALGTGTSDATTFLRGDGSWSAAPVSSVAGKTGVVTLTNTDISGLGNASTMNVGTAAGTIAAGDDTRIIAAVQKDGSVAMTGNLDLNSKKVVNLGTPTGAADAATKEYVDAAGTSSGGKFTISCSSNAISGQNTCVRMDTSTGATDCSYSNYQTIGTWTPCGGSPFSATSSSTGDADFKQGYFVLTYNNFNANLGGLAGANAACLNELTNYPWSGKGDAQSRGLLVASKVKAFLCDESSCNDGLPFTKYQFATVGSASTGGAIMFTDGSGKAPGDATSYWHTAGYFGANVSYWTGRNSLTGYYSTLFGSVAAGQTCNNWTSNSSSSYFGQYGSSGSSTVSRWCQDPGGNGYCSAASFNCGTTTNKLVCWIHP